MASSSEPVSEIELFVDNAKQDDEAQKKAWAAISVPISKESISDDLKHLIRGGIVHSMRPQFWLLLSGASAILSEKPYYYSRVACGLSKTAESIVESRSAPPSIFEFGGLLRYGDHKLTQEGRLTVDRILFILAEQFHLEVPFCPRLCDLIPVLLRYLTEAETYTAISSMITFSRNTHWFLTLTGSSHLVEIRTFVALASKKLPNIIDKLKKMFIDTDALFSVWFNRLFFTVLTPHAHLRFMDCFLNEGSKILFRMGLAILKLLEPPIRDSIDQKSLKAVLTNGPQTLNEDQLFKTAFKFSLSRKDIEELETRVRSGIPSSQMHEVLEGTGRRSKSFLRPRVADSSRILTTDQSWMQFWTMLPPRSQERVAHLLFSAAESGFALSALWRFVQPMKGSEPDAPCALIIRGHPKSGSLESRVFGVYLTQPLKPSSSVYGHNESFLFSLPNPMGVQPANAPPVPSKPVESGKPPRSTPSPPIEIASTSSISQPAMHLSVPSVARKKNALASQTPPSASPMSLELSSSSPSSSGLASSSIAVPSPLSQSKPVAPPPALASGPPSPAGGLQPVAYRPGDGSEPRRVSLEGRTNLSFFALTSERELLFGGGGEGYGLRLPAVMVEGSSFRSQTFKNEPLHGPISGDFEVEDIEVWTFSLSF